MKETKNKRKILVFFVISILLITLSFTYANISENNTSQNLVLGDIYMYYNKSSSAIVMDEITTSDTYDPNTFFEFTVSGKNTYTKKDIWYDIVLSHGDAPGDKNIRISDELLSFRLVEVVNSEEVEIFTNKSFFDLTKRRIYINNIPKNTLTELNKTYRLYVWINEKFTVCAGEATGCIYDEDDYDKLYASLDVSVTGDFLEKEFPVLLLDVLKDDIYSRVDENGDLLVATEEDGITYISGSTDQDETIAETDVDFNYVWYSGKLWRIIQINADGSMKMITQDGITTMAYYRAFAYYNNSWIYQFLNEDFLDTLYNHEKILVKDSLWNVTLGNGNISYKLPETKMVSAKIGLLNSYEFYKSYEKLGDSTNGYLNIGYGWWLSNSYSKSGVYNWCVAATSSGTYCDYSNTELVRAVININSNIELKGGTGTKTDPYRIKGDKEEAVENTTLLNTRTSGEYVNFDGELYRIVGIENNTTKLNKVDYIKDENDQVVEKKFSSSLTYGSGTDDTYWDYYLNNTWYNNVTSNYKDMLVEGIYYLGTVSSPGNYKLSICETVDVNNAISTKECGKTTSTWTGYVGLPRYGEMFASQFGIKSSATKYMWLITPNSQTSSNSTDVWYLSTLGSGYGGITSISSDTLAVRPSINLKSEVIITGGSGTENDPYEITEKITNFSYNSSTSYYTYNVSTTGTYKIELWGARGGYGRRNAVQVHAPGNGGYTSGEIELTQGDTLYIYIGGMGGSPGSTSITGGSAGYNGGGKGGNDSNGVSGESNNEPGGGGGGATDIRYFGTTTPTASDLTWNSTLGLNSRIMVAAGGAGSAETSVGGYAGGLTGGIGGVSASTPGSQTGGYAFGQGASGSNSYTGGPGGGGGGYYGGKAGTANDSTYVTYGGSGGSSFISGHTGSVAITSSSDRTPRIGTDGAACANGTTDNLCSIHYSGKIFTNTIIINGSETMPGTSGEEEVGHASSGYARITYLEE